jgi:hypothetical protein
MPQQKEQTVEQPPAETPVNEDPAEVVAAAPEQETAEPEVAEPDAEKEVPAAKDEVGKKPIKLIIANEKKEKRDKPGLKIVLRTEVPEGESAEAAASGSSDAKYVVQSSGENPLKIKLKSSDKEREGESSGHRHQHQMMSTKLILLRLLLRVPRGLSSSKTRQPWTILHLPSWTRRSQLLVAEVAERRPRLRGPLRMSQRQRLKSRTCPRGH